MLISVVFDTEDIQVQSKKKFNSGICNFTLFRITVLLKDQVKTSVVSGTMSQGKKRHLQKTKCYLKICVLPMLHFL